MGEMERGHEDREEGRVRIPNPPSWQHISNGSNIASGIIKARPEEVEGRESMRKWKESLVKEKSGHQ